MEISDWGMENHVQGSGKLRSKARDTGGGGGMQGPDVNLGIGDTAG